MTRKICCTKCEWAYAEDKFCPICGPVGEAKTTNREAPKGNSIAAGPVNWIRFMDRFKIGDWVMRNSLVSQVMDVREDAVNISPERFGGWWPKDECIYASANDVWAAKVGHGPPEQLARQAELIQAAEERTYICSRTGGGKTMSASVLQRGNQMHELFEKELARTAPCGMSLERVLTYVRSHYSERESSSSLEQAALRTALRDVEEEEGDDEEDSLTEEEIEIIDRFAEPEFTPSSQERMLQQRLAGKNLFVVRFNAAGYLELVEKEEL